VLRFSTAVSVAVERGATVLPYPWEDDRAETYAAQHNALLAGGGPDAPAGARWSPSPVDLAGLRTGTRLVLPSPNGSELAFDEARHDLREWLLASTSGRELVGRGRHDDVVAAAALDVAAIAPVLVGAAFVGAPP
jgi:2-phosphosulfolactate phosphatase